MIIGLHIYEREALLMENALRGSYPMENLVHIRMKKISVSIIFILHSLQN